MAEIKILVLPPPSLRRKLFSADAEAALRSFGEAIFNDDERNFTSNEMAGRLRDVSVMITGWRAPRLTAEAIAAATKLRLIAHTAGSVKFMISESLLHDDRILVTTAAAAMSEAVAEMALQLTLMCLRPIHQLDAGLKAGVDWSTLKARGSGTELSQCRIGVVGAGHIGRHYIRMLRALRVETAVFDPYLSDAGAAELDVQREESLEALMRSCRVIALHAPSTPETNQMIGARQLAEMEDGAILINTARSSLVDGDALLAELRSGRLIAALDVFDDEPLPVESPLRRLPNVILTPHVASHTAATYRRQGDMVVDEVRRLVAGEPLQHVVTSEAFATMA